MYNLTENNIKNITKITDFFNNEYFEFSFLAWRKARPELVFKKRHFITLRGSLKRNTNNKEIGLLHSEARLENIIDHLDGITIKVYPQLTEVLNLTWDGEIK